MRCEVIVTDEFRAWYESTLSAEEQKSVARIVGMLERLGVALPFPYSSGISGSRHGGMREMRVQHQGRPIRILYAFDPARDAVLLLGGEKTADARWYEREVPRADRLLDNYLNDLEVSKPRRHPS